MEIAAAVIGFLSPYLAEAGKSMAGRAGDAAAVVGRSLYEAMRRRFHEGDDSYAAETLARLEAQPDSDARRQNLQNVIAEKLAEDSSFSEEIRELLADAEHRFRLVYDVEEMVVRDVEAQTMDVTEGASVDVDARMTGSKITGDRLRIQTVRVRHSPEGGDGA